MRKTTVGGQAVIEGVMMRGSKGLATAVRLPNGKIEIKEEKNTSLTKKNKLLGLPIIRGFVSSVSYTHLTLPTTPYV